MNSERSDPLAPPDRPERTLLQQLFTLTTERGFISHGEGLSTTQHMGWSNQCPHCIHAVLQIVHRDVAVPARAHHPETEEKKDVMARSGTTEIRDRQPAAATDAGSPNDCAETKNEGEQTDGTSI